MQGDLYLNLRSNRQFLVYVDKGLYAVFEAFGLAKVLPLDGYLKTRPIYSGVWHEDR